MDTGATRLFDWFQVGALVGWAVLGVGRAVIFHRRGVRVLAPDRQRSAGQMVVDLLAAVCLVLLAHEIVAAVRPSLRLFKWPDGLGSVVVENVAVRLAGAVFVAGGLVIYGVALRDLGGSWRLGIDRNAPGPLVTGGIYGWSRNPIYLGFYLVFAGMFLVNGRVVLLLLVVMMVAVVHSIVLREERFLGEVFGEEYEEYRRKVGRYF